MKKLQEWYEEIDKENIDPNGTIQIRVSSDDVEEIEKENDKVERKNKYNSLKAFFYARKIQDLLLELASLESPFSNESIERQDLVDKIRQIHSLLGEEIASL